MSVFLQPIYTQTVGASGVGSITFNNIPQTFTDLKLVTSSRSNASGTIDTVSFQFNGDTSSSYSMTRLYGSGSSAASDRYTSNNGSPFDILDGSTAIANTFGNAEYYIPNYTSSNYKQFINDAVSENNTTASYQLLESGLWSKTNAITSIKISVGTYFVQYSTFTLYGILRSGI